MDFLDAYAPTDRSVGMIRLNMISSLDGAAWVDGRAGGLGGPVDQALMQVLRALADVVMVGAGTVRVEGYEGDLISTEWQEWRVSQGFSRHPRFVIVSRSGPTLPTLLREFEERGDTQVLCEGGPHLLGSLAALDRIDELCLTLGPLLVGPGPGRITAGDSHPIRRMRLVHAIPHDEFLFLRYARITQAWGE